MSIEPRGRPDDRNPDPKRTFQAMPEDQTETVAVLGASPKPDRYAYRAMEMLRRHGHRPIPVNPAFQEVLGEPCYGSIADIPEKVETITMYLGRQRSDPLIEQIVAAKPRRIIMNPGAENDNLAAKARAAGIEVVEDCTLVMLQSGDF
ncbi:MAG: CoA-binding protein [Chthoniobacterales bacterium]